MAGGLLMKRNKYGAIKTTLDGMVFDSKAEAERWAALRQRFLAKEITHLARQVSFQLTAHGKVICNYIADFTYVENGEYIVEDVKGVVTRDFALKSKLVEAQYGYKIRIYKKKSKKIKVQKLPAGYAFGSVSPKTVRPRQKGKKND
jgi:ribosomal protein S17